MPFEIVRNDIVNMQVDAIVNTANPNPVVGRGTDTRIHEAAGPELLKARQQIGRIPRGSAAITPAFGLQARYVIHTVGPVWQGGNSGEKALLGSCYENALQLALEHDCRSIAFPLISTGNYEFPKDLALQIAISVFSSFLTRCEMQIYLVVFDGESYKLSENLFRNVASYIDEHYVAEYMQVSCTPSREDSWDERSAFPMATGSRAHRASGSRRETVGAPPPSAPKPMSLAELLKKTDAGFTETLLRLIDKAGKRDSEIYKKANISKQHFSKIRNNPDYKPTKATAIALALALELDLAQTTDLIGRAGFALTSSSKFDLIIRYFIEQGNYNVVEINIALYEFDQPLLGA